MRPLGRQMTPPHTMFLFNHRHTYTQAHNKQNKSGQDFSKEYPATHNSLKLCRSLAQWQILKASSDHRRRTLMRIVPERVGCAQKHGVGRRTSNTSATTHAHRSEQRRTALDRKEMDLGKRPSVRQDDRTKCVTIAKISKASKPAQCGGVPKSAGGAPTIELCS